MNKTTGTQTWQFHLIAPTTKESRTTSADNFNGLGGNDTLAGGTGNDTLNGGESNDVAIYQGNYDDYQVTLDEDENTWTVKDIMTDDETEDFIDEDGDGVDDNTGETVDEQINGNKVADEGYDTLTNIETLRFNDQDMTYELYISGSDIDPIPEPIPGPIDPDPIPDPSLTMVQFDTTDLALMEGDFGSLTISLSEVSDQEVSATYITSGSAIVDADYWLGDGDTYWYDDSGNQWIEETVTFAPGEISKELSIETYYDDVYEIYEEFTVTLTDAVNAELGANTMAIVGIIDDSYYYY